MTKSILQTVFILTLLVGASLAEAFLPVAIPEQQAPNRFYTPDGLEGTLTGWQQCFDAGQAIGDNRTDAQIIGHCRNGYAVLQQASVAISALQVYENTSTCSFNPDMDTPYRRFLSATLTNQTTGIYVARLRLSIANPTKAGDASEGVIDVWLAPGESAHRCLGIEFDFDTANEAMQFDQMIDRIKIKNLGVFGVSSAAPKRYDAETGLGKLPAASRT